MRRPSLGACLLGLVVCLLGGGCEGLEGLRPDAPPCTNSADYTGRTFPYRTVPIDGTAEFDPEAERLGGSASGHAAFVSWDECRLYFGFSGSRFGAAASPHAYLSLYLDTDPLGHAGSVHPRPLSEGLPRLPFQADYLLEVRTDGRTVEQDSASTYRGNVQLYRRSIRWAAGLVRHWDAQGRDALQLAASREEAYLEVAVDRRALGRPCAVQMAAWIVDTRRSAPLVMWPSPDTLARGAGTQGAGARDAGAGGSGPRDSLGVNYYGFQLRHQTRPSAPANFNRTDYNDVGRCARGDD